MASSELVVPPPRTRESRPRTRSLRCTLHAHSLSGHLHQLYTGFYLLHRRGVLDLTQRIVRRSVVYPGGAQHLRDAGHAHLDVVLETGARLHFDTHDSGEIALDELAKVDFYFKRSYSPHFLADLPDSQRQKVFPLGLNYRVLPDAVDLRGVSRALRLDPRPLRRRTALMDAIDVGDVLGFRPRLTKMEGLPCYGAPPKILFLVTAYDPDDHPDRSAAKAEERYQINETRASCLRLLKQALGPRFFGGFDRNPYTLERYPDLVVPQAVTAQGSYIDTMRSYPICVATTGLHDSIGWKLAEYVAFGKAIVSEKLNYEVPGEFAPERNYLEFSSAEECVVAAERLLEDPGRRKAMMTSNTRYYEAYVRPDALVLNALLTALSRY